MSDNSPAANIDDQEAPALPTPSLEEQLADKNDEIASLNDKLLRLAAEMENMRRRLEKDRQDASVYAVSNFARDMLSVADNLRRALEVIPETARQDASFQGVITGIEVTEKDLLSVFGRYGVQPIMAQGERLDPNLHQAVAQVESDTHEPGAVVQVFQTGYTIKDRLLRPAMVTVAKAPATAEASSANPGGRVDTLA